MKYWATVSDNMDNISYRAVIRYPGLKGLTTKKIHKDMVVKLEENAPSYSMVKKWDAQFKRGSDSLEEEPRPRRPVAVTTQETIAKIHDIIKADKRVTEHYIATELGISQDRIHNELPMSKVLARCVLTFSGRYLKQTRLNMSTGNLVIFKGDSNSFLQNFVTMDENGVHHFPFCGQSNNWNNGNTYVLRLPRTPRLGCPQARWWPPLFELQKVCCWWTI